MSHYCQKYGVETPFKTTRGKHFSYFSSSQKLTNRGVACRNVKKSVTCPPMDIATTFFLPNFLHLTNVTIRAPDWYALVFWNMVSISRRHLNRKFDNFFYSPVALTLWSQTFSLRLSTFKNFLKYQYWYSVCPHILFLSDCPFKSSHRS